jgi:dihydrofolate synthase/folylpolyglutamate synthase
VELAEASAYLEGLINVERLPDLRVARLSLAPIRALLARLGDPQRGLHVLHVAGSKGKGSTALLAEALLQQAGLRVGTFTSPHLLRWTERFRIDGREVSGALLGAAVGQLKPHVDALRAGADAPSFFDATTAAALLLFQQARLDVAILEVGLGGRLDSTNVVDPAVCCITSIELEHTEKLGDTLAAIAGEKVGIAKAGVPLVCGALSPEAAAVVVRRARELGCPLVRIGSELELELLETGPLGSRFRIGDGGFRAELSLGVAGAHQVPNAALALAAVRRLDRLKDPALLEAARAVLPRVRLPARSEIVSRSPWLVIDAAHTAASAQALARVLEGLPRRATHLVLSVSAGKDLTSICQSLATRADRVTVTRAEPIRSLPPQQLAEAVRAAAPDAELRIVPDPQLALQQARQQLADDELLCVAGSIYLAGIARQTLGAHPGDS